MRKLMILGACLGMAVATAQAGVTFTFSAITNNLAGNPELGEAQLRMEVSEVGDKVHFDFFHDGGVDMSITAIYFDEPGAAGSLLTFDSLNEGPGVGYSVGGAPSNLPGGNSVTPAFVATQWFTANPPPSLNGVEPGETLGIIFSGTYANVLAALFSGDLRVGMHVQSIDGPLGDSSESFIHVPAPGAALLGLIGLVTIRGATHRRWLN